MVKDFRQTPAGDRVSRRTGTETRKLGTVWAGLRIRRRCGCGGNRRGQRAPAGERPSGCSPRPSRPVNARARPLQALKSDRLSADSYHVGPDHGQNVVSTEGGKMNTGEAAVDWLYREQLRVDAEWSVKTPHGFRWWPDQHAQTIEVTGRETGPAGEEGWWISVRTEVVRLPQLRDEHLEPIRDLLMTPASMAGPTYHAENGTLELASLVRVYEGNVSWMRPLIGLAAMLQVLEARKAGPLLAEALGAEEAWSAPQGKPVRETPDELVEGVPLMILASALTGSRWKGPELKQLGRREASARPALLATGDERSLTVEFPFGDESSLCQFGADVSHPEYGPGLLIVQTFPVMTRDEAEGIRLALAMNERELIRQPWGYGYGSYSHREGFLNFSCFLPALAHRPGMLVALYHACAVRAAMVARHFTGRDWDASSFGVERTGVARFLNLLRNRLN